MYRLLWKIKIKKSKKGKKGKKGKKAKKQKKSKVEKKVFKKVFILFSSPAPYIIYEALRAIISHRAHGRSFIVICIKKSLKQSSHIHITYFKLNVFDLTHIIYEVIFILNIQIYSFIILYTSLVYSSTFFCVRNTRLTKRCIKFKTSAMCNFLIQILPSLPVASRCVIAEQRLCHDLFRLLQYLVAYANA